MPRKIAHIHAKYRARHRYNEKLNRVDLLNIIGLVQNSKAEKICHISNSRSIYKVEYSNKNYIIVYSKTNKCIVTFLPPESEMRYRRRGLNKNTQTSEEVLPETWEDAIRDLFGNEIEIGD